MSVPSIELWRAYLAYIKRRFGQIEPADSNQPEEDAEAARQTRKLNRQTIQQAFETALAAIGMCHLAGTLWTDYLDWLKAQSTESFYDEQVKMDALRKVYTRALQTPNQCFLLLLAVMGSAG